MKSFSFTLFFKKGLVYIFLLASLFICAVIADWNKIYNYIDHFSEKNCEPAKAIVISFGIYDSAPLFLNPFEIVKGLFYLISLPSIIIKELLMSDLKSRYSYLCPETFDIIGMIYFLIINSFYWMVLGYLIELAHNYYCKTRLPPKKPFSIFGRQN